MVRPSLRRRSAFTLIELLLAIVIFSIILASINGIFYSAIRLRKKTVDALDESLPVQHAMAIVRKDLAGIAVPGGTMGGGLRTGATGTSSSTGSSGSGITAIEMYTTSANLDDYSPWGDIQKVAYALRPPTNRTDRVGQDLVRYITRNLLPTLAEQVDEQRLLSGVTDLQVQFYDGTQWRTTWESSTETVPLPKAVQWVMQMSLPVDPNADPGLIRRDVNLPVRLTVPILVTASTNQTTSTTGGSQ